MTNVILKMKVNETHKQYASQLYVDIKYQASFQELWLPFSTSWVMPRPNDQTVLLSCRQHHHNNKVDFHGDPCRHLLATLHLLDYDIHPWWWIDVYPPVHSMINIMHNIPEHQSALSKYHLWRFTMKNWWIYWIRHRHRNDHPSLCVKIPRARSIGLVLRRYLSKVQMMY